jgi:proteasome regulatory subunit
MLRETVTRLNNELDNLRSPALMVAEIQQVMGDRAIIRIPNGNRFMSYVSRNVTNIKRGDTVLIEQKNLNIIDKVTIQEIDDVEKFIIVEKPKECWKDIGGLQQQIREIKEVIELPLKKPQLFENVGIKPPKGILLYGPPGTGKTLLAKAVAQSTKATFIEVVGSELVQKFIGDGARLVKDIFNLARQKAPSIVFIDEIDALAAKRMDTGTSGEREVNRTFMQLLAELDGFKHLGNVKVIGATNRKDILDESIIRPGRLDRLLYIGLPDEEGREEIMKVHTKKMNLRGVRLKELVGQMERFSGADIQAACTEAGYFAIRNNRDYVTQQDFLNAIEKVKREEEEDLSFFG